MTVPNSTSRSGPYAGAGTTGPFAIGFPFLENAHLAVIRKDAGGVATTLTNGIDFVASGAGSSLGGSLLLVSPLAVGYTLTIQRSVPVTQLLDYTQSDSFPAESHEQGLDKLTMIAQAITQQLMTALRVPEDTATFPSLGDAAARANRILAFDAQGNPLLVTGIDSSSATALALDLANAGNVSKGDAQVAVQLIATGAKARTQHDKNADYVTIADFAGIDLTGATDSTAGLQAALNASLRLDFMGAPLKLVGALNLRSGHNLRGAGATITQTAIRTEVFNYEGKSNIEIAGFNMVGVGTDFNESDSSRAVAVFGSGGEANINVHDNTFTGFSYTPLRAVGAAGVKFVNNVVVGPGHPTLTSVTSGRCYGVLADVGCSDVLIAGNSISKCAQGVRVEQSSDVRVIGNRIRDITGQHGIYAGAALTRFVAAYNIISNTDLIGIKVQNNDANVSDTVGVTVVGNQIDTAGDQGILIYSSTPSAVYKVRDVVCSDNVVRGVTANGINVGNIVGGIVDGNRIRTTTQSALIWSDCDDLTISNNRARDSVLSAYRDQVVSTNVTVRGNTGINCASGATLGDRYGLFVQSAASYVIDDNKFTDANAKMEYGVYVAAGTMSGVAVTNNIVSGATAAGARFPSPAQVLQAYFGNIWGGAVATTNDPICPTVASVAGAMTIPQGYKVLHVSGAAAVTSIPVNGHTGATVMFIFDSTATFVDGSNLIIAGAAGGALNRTVTLGCDGLNWYEGGRSAN